MPPVPRPAQVGAFEKGLRVMRVLAGASGGMTQAEVAAAAGITRASARRLLLTLVEQGYARQSGARLSLTPQVLTLGGARFDRGLAWELARPHLEALGAELGESVSAAVRDGAEIVYAARAQARRIMAVTLDVGSRLPAAPTAMGRVLLADLPEAEQRALLAAAPPEALTPRTLTEPEALLAELARVRAQGYALSDEELELGLRSVAVPLRDASGRVHAALNVAAQASRVPAARMVEAHVPALLRCAERIAAATRPAG